MKKLVAKKYYSGFPLAHDTYNTLSAASDGHIYYVLSSEDPVIAGQVYRYNPLTEGIDWVGDLSEWCGEKDSGVLSQGKSHVEFEEIDGKLYFSTHVGFYEMIDGMERLPVHPPQSLALYPGGHFLAYDLQQGTAEDLGIMPDGEGVLSMITDRQRMQIYAISWPTGQFIHFDISTGEVHNLGRISSLGEAGVVGQDYRVLCRSLLVVPETGWVYFSTAEGDIVVYKPEKKQISVLDNVHLRLDYFGQYDPLDAGSMGYNWRKVIWHPEEKVAYGMHGNSGYLFRFDPAKETVEIVERLTSLPSRKRGMFDLFSYGYLGFEIDFENNRIYYLTGGPYYEDGSVVKGAEKIAKGGAKGIENLHLITYDLDTDEYKDHGSIVYDDGSIPTYVNSIALDAQKNIYTLARMMHEGKEIQDLIKIDAVF